MGGSMHSNELNGVKMRSITGRIEMSDVILALVDVGNVNLAARIAETQDDEEDDGARFM